MIAEQARVIIGNDAHFRTWQEWIRLGRPTAYNMAKASGRPESTIKGHLWSAQLKLNKWAMSQPDTHEEETHESEHAAECRQLSIITIAEGHNVRTLTDQVGKKILLRSA